MSLEALQSYTFTTKYARYNKEKKRRESWDESIERVMAMHREKYASVFADETKRSELEAAFEFCSQAMKKKLVLGSQRALQFGGKPILAKNPRIFNCSTSFCDRPRFYAETIWMLLCGCGVGFSVQKHHVAKLPDLVVPSGAPETFVIPDTIEGWADALGVLMASFGIASPEWTKYIGKDVEFDYSKIRPKGSDLSSGVGKAPGHEPLKNSLEKVLSLLRSCAGARKRLRPIDAYDIIMHASDAVLAGGVRRSATICLFSKDDQEMIKAKVGNWFETNPQRGRSNNSAILLRDSTSKEEFAAIMESVKECGEPGFVWADSTEGTFNPCVEINLYTSISAKDVKKYTTKEQFESLHIDENQEELLSGFATCVSADTRLITKDGIENIKEAVGKEIEIWNGVKWSSVTPFKTGSGRKLYRVKFRDGSYLDATANHKWLVKDRFMNDYVECETSNLMSMSKYQIHVPRSNIVYEHGIREEFAYEYGVLLGDGSHQGIYSPRVRLFGAKIKLPVRGTRSVVSRDDGYSVDGQTVGLVDLDKTFSKELKTSDSLPKIMFSWSRDTILRFVAGWADTDGSNANSGIRIYGTEGRIRDAQLLLSKAGVNASINLMSEAGAATNYGERTQDIWYLQIVDARSIPCNRLNVVDGKPAKCRGKDQVVVSVTELPGLHDTFCLTEPDNHTCVFNNVLTKQCNLCELNMRLCTTEEKWEEACTAAAILGTLQAGYTDFGYLGPVSDAIAKREALLGVSMTGLMDNPKLAFNKTLQQKMAKHILEVNERIALLIGINPTARATCIKPAGSTSCVLGTASGIHAHHAKRYFRRVQANELETPLQYFKLHNPLACEKSVWSANKTDQSIIFCVDVPEDALTKKDINAIKQLEYVKLTQQNWVKAGRVVERCAAPFLNHNVSNTINVAPDEWEKVTDFIYENREFFAGISLIPSSGDLSYVQAPMCRVLTAAELVEEYGDAAIMASGLIVDGKRAFGDNLWAACDCVKGIGESLDADNLKAKIVAAKNTPNQAFWDEEGLNSRSPKKLLRAYIEHTVDNYPEKVDWVRRVKQFAERYLAGDLTKCLYCLKESSNLKLWNDLKRTYVPVDWLLFEEKNDPTQNIGLDIACGGQGCEMK